MAGGADDLPHGIEVDKETALILLREGELEIVGRLVTASNATLLCRVSGRGPGRGDDLESACVYKPIRGERPLWDFPHGTLANREVAAHELSAATGWDVVPPTVLRGGPLGRGMVQLWIDVDERVDPIELFQSNDPALRRMALFDVAVNNADRKIGHLLPARDGHVYGVDHGVCFAVDPKLRTVLWGWRGEPLRDDEVEVLGRLRMDLRGDLGTRLRRLLSADETAATCERVDRLLATRRFPQPDPDRPVVPWPLV